MQKVLMWTISDFHAYLILSGYIRIYNPCEVILFILIGKDIHVSAEEEAALFMWVASKVMFFYGYVSYFSSGVNKGKHFHG